MLAQPTRSRYHALYRESFINGMLYTFTFRENTLRKIADKHKNGKDQDNMLHDWENVGGYIRQACERFKEENGQ
jgi:hypothetical protein